jgi:hypothetical protein
MHALGFHPLEDTLADLTDQQAERQETIQAKTGRPSDSAQHDSLIAKKKEERKTPKKQGVTKHVVVSPHTTCESKFA